MYGGKKLDRNIAERERVWINPASFLQERPDIFYHKKFVFLPFKRDDGVVFPWKNRLLRKRKNDIKFHEIFLINRKK